MRVSRAHRNRLVPAPMGLAHLMLGVLAFVLLSFVTGPPAQAHAEFVAANPQPGIGIPQPPGAVVIEFSEPLNLKLSDVSVLDGSGNQVTVGPVEPVRGDPKSIQRKLGLLPTGPYTVEWTSVSALDGHILKGSYSFGIGVGTFANRRLATGPVASEGWLGLAGHAVELAGLLLWAGTAILAGAARRAGVDRHRLQLLTVAGPVAALVGTGVAGVSSALVSAGSVGAVDEVFTSSTSGRLRLALLAISLAGAGVALIRSPPVVNLSLVSVALILEAASGHAADAAHPLLTVASFTLHMFAVGVWMFAIVASTLSSKGLRSSLAIFSPYAIGSAALVAGTGITNASTQLGSISELSSSGYGKILLGKSIAFVAMVAFGLTHNRWRRTKSEKRIRVPVRAELTMGVLAVTLAAILIGFPNSPAGAGDEHPLSTGIDPVLKHLHGRPALSAAAASGPFVAALTVLPPSPGRVQFRAQILGLQAGDGPRDARVTGSSQNGGRFDVPLRPCGMGCFMGPGSVPRGRWRLDLHIRTNRGAITTKLRTSIPAPAGYSLFARARRAMDRLRSARMLETLTSDTRSPGIRSVYRFHSPDQLAIRTNQTETLIVGHRTYRRQNPKHPWHLQGGGFGFHWPTSYFRGFWGRPVAATLLEEARVGSVRTDVVSFLRPDLPAWFRLWVGIDDGLVYREQMRAEGHFMDHRYSGFDSISRLRPPAHVAP